MFIVQKLINKILVGSANYRKTGSLKLGKAVHLDTNLVIHAGFVEIGDFTYIGMGRISSLPSTRITIGKFTSIANGIQIIGALHRSHIANYPLSRLLPYKDKNIEHGISRGDIVIGNDVWIGANVIILSGVTIGDGAVIGAGAVVTKPIPPYSIAVVVPAKVIKKRFDDKDIEHLLNAKWWDWNDENIMRMLPMFYDDSMSVKDFLNKFKKY